MVYFRVSKLQFRHDLRKQLTCEIYTEREKYLLGQLRRVSLVVLLFAHVSTLHVGGRYARTAIKCSLKGADKVAVTRIREKAISSRVARVTKIFKLLHM